MICIYIYIYMRISLDSFGVSNPFWWVWKMEWLIPAHFHSSWYGMKTWSLSLSNFLFMEKNRFTRHDANSCKLLAFHSWCLKPLFHWWHALGEIEGLTRAHLPPMNWPYQSTSGDFRLCDVCLLSVKSFGLEAGDNVRQTMHHWHQPYRACQSGNDNDLWHLQTAWNVELLLHQPAKKRSTQLFWSLTTAKFHIITKSQQDSLLFFFSGI